MEINIFGYYLIDIDPIIRAWSEDWAGWLGRNIVTASIAVNVLQYIKKKAIESNNVPSNKILDYLIALFTFRLKK
jgi:hypothetical protein